MKKSELIQIIKEEIKKELNKNSRMSGMKLIRKLTPDIENKINNLKIKYPLHKFSITSNDRFRPDDKDLRGTYTLGYSGPDSDELEDIIDNI
jgi:hypothetical protein